MDIDQSTKDRLIPIGIMMIMTITSFFFGRWSMSPNHELEDVPYVSESQEKAPEGQNMFKSTQTDTIQSNPTETGLFVASKNGTKYYPKGCKSADRIKPENQVWFATGQEAESRGYELSTQCQ